jgi:ribose transport system ATP-binding protein
LLELNNVSGKIKPHNVTLKLAKGEVVGLAGLLGSGLDSTYGGEMKIKGRPTSISSPEEAIASGIALVPEARATQGIIASHSVKNNLTLATLNEIASRSFISDVQESTYTQTTSRCRIQSFIFCPISSSKNLERTGHSVAFFSLN